VTCHNLTDELSYTHHKQFNKYFESSETIKLGCQLVRKRGPDVPVFGEGSAGTKKAVARWADGLRIAWWGNAGKTNVRDACIF